jgi:hypothetical protein
MSQDLMTDQLIQNTECLLAGVYKNNNGVPVSDE